MSNAKRDERERRQRVLRRRRAGFGLVVLVLLGMVVWGIAALWRAPIFSITRVEVDGATHLSPSRVTSMAALPKDATLFHINTAAIERKVASDPWVAKVRVIRSFPHTLRIVVTERTPAALVDAGGAELWLVSPDGTWLGKRTAEDTASVVTIRDIEGLKPAGGRSSGSAELGNALAVLEGISPELRARVSAISAQSVDKTTLLTKDNVEIVVGSSEDLETKDAIARQILSEQAGKVVYINVRVTDRPIWRGLDTTN